MAAESTQFLMSYHAVIPAESGLLDWVSENGGCRELEDFARKQLHAFPTPEEHDRYEFRLTAHFGQVEKNYALAFIVVEVRGNGGSIELNRSLSEFNSHDSFLGYVENALRKALPHGLDERITEYPNDTLSEVEEAMEELGEEEKKSFGMPVPEAFIAALVDIGRENERKAERWKNIMEI